jgi:hypothetical protein
MTLQRRRAGFFVASLVLAAGGGLLAVYLLRGSNSFFRAELIKLAIVLIGLAGLFGLHRFFELPNPVLTPARKRLLAGIILGFVLLQGYVLRRSYVLDREIKPLRDLLAERARAFPKSPSSSPRVGPNAK